MAFRVSSGHQESAKVCADLLEHTYAQSSGYAKLHQLCGPEAHARDKPHGWFDVPLKWQAHRHENPPLAPPSPRLPT